MPFQRVQISVILVAGSAVALAMAPTGPETDPPTDIAQAGVTNPDVRPPLPHGDPLADKSRFVTAFTTFYPSTTLPSRMTTAAGENCFVCHQPSGKGDLGNCYKNDLLLKLDQGMNIDQAIAAIDGDDSDSDGTPNGEEIRMVRVDLPSEVGYNPGLIGPTGTSPCSNSPAAAITNMPETPPVVCYADCDTSTGVGTLDIFDFLCFQNSFVAGQAYACDCDTSTGPLTCDIFDFLCFQNAFVAGCP